MKQIFLLLPFFLIAGCIETGSDESLQFRVTEPITVPIENEQVTFQMINEAILTPLCVRCHGWASDEPRVNSRIKPGFPEESRLFTIVESGSMRIGGPVLTLEQLDLLRRYIMDMNENSED